MVGKAFAAMDVGLGWISTVLKVSRWFLETIWLLNDEVGIC